MIRRGLILLVIASCCLLSSCGSAQGLRIQPVDGGHRVSFTTKYIHGDKVSYDSELNGSGEGQIESIDVDRDGVVRYTIGTADNEWQPGILEEEITER